jgi:hypothetical protein
MKPVDAAKMATAKKSDGVMKRASMSSRRDLFCANSSAQQHERQWQGE